jgi:hypothetical protein
MKRPFAGVAVLVLALLISTQPQPAAAQPMRASPTPTEDTGLYPGGQNVEFIGHSGGSFSAVAVGDPWGGSGQAYAYVGEGPQLTILDISNPASPEVAGKSSLLPDLVEDVYIAAAATPGITYAFVANGDGGLRVMDVSAPSEPREVGVLKTAGRASGVAVVTDEAWDPSAALRKSSGRAYAYVAAMDAGLRVVDVSNPWDPR